MTSQARIVRTITAGLYVLLTILLAQREWWDLAAISGSVALCFASTVLIEGSAKEPPR